MAALGKQLEHLGIEEAERKVYNRMVAESKTAAASLTTFGPYHPNSLPCKLHYSFDYVQQVHMPSTSL